MEEVWKLAEQLKKVQQSTAKQKLSERNVIELVSKLVELKFIDVLYTSDGKTYLTHQQLAKEIRDELIVNGGRINLVDLQQILNVDFSHIEAKANEMVKHDGHLVLILGQLIDSTYRDRLAEDINDLLQEKGHVTVIELTKSHNLPADFLREVIGQYLGRKIKGQIDSYDQDIVFTDAFVSRMKAQIRGAFSAVTMPTTIGPVRQSLHCQEHLFHSILEELISSGRLAGTLSGSRQDKSQFLPEVYTRAQTQWVESFYKENGYLEYDALSRQGISEPKSYIKKKFKSESLVFLSSCCVGPAISEQVIYSVDETLNLGGWVDIMTVLPSVLSQTDASELLQDCVKTRPSAIVCDLTIVACDKLITDSLPVFEEYMNSYAEKAAKSHPAVVDSGGGATGTKASASKVTGLDDGSSAREDKKDQRRKKAATAGSTKKEGTGGREVKMKSTKKKGGRGRDVEGGSDEEVGVAPSASKGKQQELKFMSVEEIQKVLAKQDNLSDCPPALLDEIATKLHRPLQRQYQEVAKSIFVKASGADRKKTAGEIQDKVNGLWTNAKLFEKGIKQFQDPVQTQLTKHLLKTVASDLTNTIVAAIASDYLVNMPEGEEHLTPEARLRVISTLPKDSQEPLSRLHSSLNGQSLEDFFSLVEQLCGPSHLGLLLKKPDKKKERQLVFNHRQCLGEQLRAETDPAMALHLASVLLFQTITQCMLHVPGRLVPGVITFLGTHLEPEKQAVLIDMQDLVVKHAKLRSDLKEGENEADLKDITDKMAALLDKVKDIALNTKKTSAAVDE